MDKIKAVLVGVLVGVFSVGTQVANASASLIVNTSGSNVGICSQSMQNCSINVAPSDCLTTPGSVSITNNSPIAAKNISASSSDSNFLTYVVQNNGCPALLYKGQSCTISFYTNTSLAFLVPNISVKGSNTNATAFDMNAITCAPTATYTISGTVSGLASTVVLQNNGGDSLTLNNNGAFSFPTSVVAGGSYNVTAQSQSAAQICTVSNGSGTNIAANVTNVQVVCQNQYAYVSDLVTHLIYQCTVNADGSLGTCTQTADFSAGEGQFGITFARVNSTQYGYVISNTELYQCSLNANGSFITPCSLLAPAFSPSAWGGPSSSIFATVNGTQYAYVVDGYSSGAVYQCTLNLDGTFNTCSFLEHSGVTSSKGIDFATVNGTQYAYLAGSGVYQCSVETDGSFSECSQTNASINGVAIAIATVNGVQYGYVSSLESPYNVYQCPINADGTFGTCSAVTSNGDVSFGIAFATINGSQYAYLANTSGTVYQCPVNATDGTFGTCTATPSSISWNPFAIAFATV